MNFYDSIRMADALLAAGYEKSETLGDASILIFNTCSVREKADEKLFSDLGRAKTFKFKAQGKGFPFIIVVCGCAAQLKASDIINRAPYVDAIVGPQEIHKIRYVVENALNRKNSKNALIFNKIDANDKFANFRSTQAQIVKRSYSENLTIQEGCNNFCAYCAVPYTRGRERSRDVADIISEVKKLVSLGVKEITLLGQNVNSYCGEGTDGNSWSFPKLLYAVSEIKGLLRLRYLTSNPKDVEENLAKAHRDIEILVPFLHIPAQSGSNEILRKMNRKYSADEYLKRIDMLRKYKPNMAFSSDFIVGFPGETDKDFEDTLKLVEKVRYAQAYSFKYSPRDKTMAAKMDNQVSEKIKTERLKLLQDILNKQQNEFNKNTLGKTVSVLFTKKGKFKNQFAGRSEYSQAVSVNDNAIEIGKLVDIKITELKSHSLFGIKI